MPALRHSSAAAARPAAGFTGSLPENIVGSVRIAVDRIHATGRSAATEARAASSSPMITAQAPSDDGQVSSYLTGSHSIGEACTDSSVMSGCCRWA
jgi:hypothetical protein